MLFISILLSVWFVLWIVFAVFIKDSIKLLYEIVEIWCNEDEPAEGTEETE